MNDNLKLAIGEAIYKIFETEIPLEDPTKTTELFIKFIEKYMEDKRLSYGKLLK